MQYNILVVAELFWERDERLKKKQKSDTDWRRKARVGGEILRWRESLGQCSRRKRRS